MKLTPSIAREIFQVLMEECEAHSDDEDSFVYAQERGCSEFRFMGNLGFGGKFYCEDYEWRVGCYKEDDTPERIERIHRVNVVLEQMRQKYENPT